ncbi:MAG: nicotinate-nucleotide adenylyltransferase [Hyphomicrobiaceae bacterium]
MQGKSAPLSFGSIKVRPPLISKGQRIGVMGGTFNPPHAGHALISRTALRRLNLDQLWWVVTPGNPLKLNNGLPPAADRMAMCRLLAGDRRMRVTAFEEALQTPFTAATLAFLVRRYPEVNFIWIMGADNLASFHRWQQWRDIAASVPIAVVDRPGWRLRALASPAAHYLRGRYVPESMAGRLTLMKPPAWTFLTGPLSRLSSTELRRAARDIKVANCAARKKG